MNVYSYYGEPLNLELELFNLYDIDFENLKVRVVPYLEHGIKGTMENKIESFSYGVYTSNGIGWVSITSSDAIYSGEINLIIEVVSSRGSFYRHYKQNLIGKPLINSGDEFICPSRGRWIKCVESFK